MSSNRSNTVVWSFLAGSAFAATACAILYRASRSQEAGQVNVRTEAVTGATKKTERTPSTLVGKTVVVTGASSGIGKAIAKAFHDRGANVAVGARRMKRLQQLCDELNAREGSGMALPVQTDVTDAPSVKRLVKEAETAFGKPVDILVNVAGVMYFTLMKNCKEDEWERTVDVNCKGVLNGFGAVLNGMVDRGQGHIITISSDAGRRVFKSLAVYCASKYFVEALSEATRRELVGTGIRVTTIQPGDCATDLVRNNTDTEALEGMGIEAGAVVGKGMGK